MDEESLQEKNVSFSSDTKGSSKKNNVNKVSFGDSTFDTTFEESQLQYPAEDGLWEGNLFENDDPFLTDPDALSRISPQKKLQGKHRVSIRTEERLSIHFDQVSSSPACRVVGTIHIVPSQDLPESFCLTVKDKHGHVERYEPADVCTNITAYVPHLALDPDDQVFRISLKDIQSYEAPIIRYNCVPQLTPMPLLLKSKIKRNSAICQVTIRIRANPKNKMPLKKMVIMMVVPPDVDGSSGTYSRQGGMWDDLKRTLCWTHDELEAGEKMDIKAQFQCTESDNATPTLPILTRCDGGSLFSRVEVCSDYTDDSSPAVQLYIDQIKSTVLYRYV